MEPEEISVVLGRASLLHSQLCQAILSFPAPSPPDSSPIPPSLDDASELRSLVSIRDALNSLREHLDSLQALQLQQRAERDFGLAEIEESRRIFLKCLREHNGRELEVIQEAFTFAGGKSSDEKNKEDEVGSMPLHHTLTSHAHLKANGEGKRLYTKEGGRSYEVGEDIDEDEDEEDEEDGERGDQEKEGRQYDEEDRSEEDLGLQYPSENYRGFPRNALLSITKDVVSKVRRSVEGSITLMRMASMALEFVKKSMGFFGKITQKADGNARVPCSKGILVVVGTIMLLSLTSSEDGKMKKSLMSRHIHRARQSCRFNHIACCCSSSSLRDKRLRRLKETYEEEEADCVLRNCFVRERVEVPFFKASLIPDVLHGRG